MLDTYTAPFETAPAFMTEAARKYESDFGIRFGSLTWFPHSVIASLQEPDAGSTIPPGVTIASAATASMADEMNVLTTVANTGDLTDSLRAAYRTSMENMFRALPHQPGEVTATPGILAVAPGREGTILAARLGYLDKVDKLTPDAKRIHCDDGLLIGLSALPPIPPYAKCILVDGAIATGTTLISLMAQLKHNVKSFEIHGGHSTIAGLWAIVNYSRQSGINVSCAVGHASGELNDHYYAVVPGSGELVIGDVGDTIASLS